ncbi:FAD-dependent oxidoreductase [Saccharibacillus brassicae]|uniref:FAD-dependent oxidoreductase n=1 Tax=Saccharibacillus brassicae TaxID=2583377 RepID=A0A4Y6UTY6_SACBS|nr:FAD-dependent oxidoreductase [Saccharibacillus brassicae]QDH21173.1 FAD-dependent oxidoreductase [Saccharibacillus brassicae]
MNDSFLVLGGGIIGLSCALELRLRGADVTLLEAGACGGQASGAAAGMLAPYSENPDSPDEFFALCRASLDLYPAWQRQVRELSGRDFEYTECGSLYAAYHEADLAALERRLDWQRSRGSSGTILRGGELRAAEPGLSPAVVAALHTPEESHIYAPDFVEALKSACVKVGVQIRERLGELEPTQWARGVEVRASGRGVDGASGLGARNAGAEAGGERQPAMQAGGQGAAREGWAAERSPADAAGASGATFRADRLVVCTGAWAGGWAGRFGLRLPVQPIRGQICAYAWGAEQVPLRHMVFGSQGYLVQKANGTLVCGASEDVAGFDTSVTEHGIARLTRWNKRMLPALEKAQPFHRWAGLRPATLDGRPLIGRLPGAERVIFAAGHYRNGILLSPVTAKRVADCAEGREAEPWQHAFRPERFGWNPAK